MTMKFVSKALFSVALASILCVCLAAEGNAVVRARALGAWVNVPAYGAFNRYVCDTGWLPEIGGGDQAASEVDYVVGSALIMDQGTAHSRSHDDCEDHHDDDDGSEIDLGHTVMMPGYASETSFSGLHHKKKDKCCKPEDDDFTAAEFTDLMFAGEPVVATGVPDQEVVIVGVGRLVLNGKKHHRRDNDCDDDDFTVEALHLYPQNGGEIIVGSNTYNRDKDCCSTRNLPRSWGSLKILYR